MITYYLAFLFLAFPSEKPEIVAAFSTIEKCVSAAQEFNKKDPNVRNYQERGARWVCFQVITGDRA